MRQASPARHASRGSPRNSSAATRGARRKSSPSAARTSKVPDFCNHYSTEIATPVAKKFVADYTAKYGKAPDDVAADI